MLREDPHAEQPLGRSWLIQKRRGRSEHSSSGTARRAVWLGRRGMSRGAEGGRERQLVKGLGYQAKERSHHIQKGAIKVSEWRTHMKKQCLGIAIWQWVESLII